MPPVDNNFDTTLAEACRSLARRWDAARAADQLDFSPEDVAHFSTNQKVAFLEAMIDYPPLPADKLAAMDRCYAWSSIANAEIRFAWQMLCLAAAYTPIYPQVVTFLGEQGRMKSLNKVDAPLARSTFDKYRAGYHPIAVRMVESDFDASTRAST
ncbi:armadillo-type protein [Syncephalis pseudoplumigaleata]|uniref:Armadillo-type protein n=1 Tax=Syncephalis pseudoplumigaleata TaxID=1712513 RepID=A0A4P9YWB6_9FUNG|nr:armadillo-type protein [Syncephalis pseudoplumigaleata]|eukprot:RKP23230.1 armadillo-type protein [Syncephalis pseudoplumigaleata]